MIPSKIAMLCLVGFVLLVNLIEARPAEGGEHVHHHHTGGPGTHTHHHHHVTGDANSNSHTHHHNHISDHETGGSGGPHVHHHETGGSGGPHVHHHELGGSGGPHVHHHELGGSGGPHVHHHELGGSGGGAGAPEGGLGGNLNAGGNLPTGGLGGNVNINGGGDGGLGDIAGNLNLSGDLGNLLSNFSPGTIKKFKKILGNLNIDLSQIDLSNLNLGNLGIGGGANVGGGGLHKFDGKDSLQPGKLQPVDCDDSINDRYGVGKHFVRGVRDVGNAIFSEAEDLLGGKGGPLYGVGQGLKALLCGIENGFSDFGSDFDSATDIAKHGLVNFFKLQGPHPVLGIPVGIAGIAGEAVKAAASIGGDAVGGIGDALTELLGNLA